jgi:hemerythrin-like domain-containing protein
MRLASSNANWVGWATFGGEVTGKSAWSAVMAGVEGVDMDAIELLRADHVAVLRLLEELERVPEDGRPVTPDDLPARGQLVTQLVMAESAHEALEEEFFWPSVRRLLAEGQELAGPAVEQEQSAKRTLAELDRVEPGEPRFEQLVSRIIADAREHIAYEENQVWPVVRERINRSELDELGRKMAGARKAAPTRPHPHTPPTPGALKTVGAAAAAVDRIRDMVTHRQGDAIRLPAAPPPTPAATPSAGRAASGGRGDADRPSGAIRLLVPALTLVLIIVAVRRRRSTAARRLRAHTVPETRSSTPSSDLPNTW